MHCFFLNSVMMFYYVLFLAQSWSHFPVSVQATRTVGRPPAPSSAVSLAPGSQFAWSGPEVRMFSPEATNFKQNTKLVDRC